MAASTITRSALTNGSTPWNVSTISSAVYDRIDELFGGVGTYATLELGGALKINGALTQLTNDGGALGTSSLGWSDLFLASGGVINWNVGDVTITHSTNTLTFAGAASGYIFNDGNVGIGVTPSYRLDVTSSAGVVVARFNQATAGKTGVIFAEAGTQRAFLSQVGLYSGNSDGNFGIFVETGYNFQIATNGSVTSKFTVTTGGNIAIGATARLYLDGVAGTGGTYIHQNTTNQMQFVGGNTTMATATTNAVISAGVIGVGFASTNGGTSTGTAIVRNADTYFYLTSSSRRFKENISPAVVTDAQLDAFMATTPSWWDYKGQKNGALGFIAEDLAALPMERYGFNPLVNYDGDGQVESNRDYALIAMHHLVIQRLERKIAALEARIH